MAKPLLLTIFFLALLEVLISANNLKQLHSETKSSQELTWLPPANVIRPLVLDYEDLAADLLWVKSVLYFSEQFLGVKKFDHLETLLNTITDLDPRFDKAYLWGGSAFIYTGNLITKAAVEQSNRLLLKGWNFYNKELRKWRVSEEFWRIPFMIGFNYAFELKDKKTAAPYFRAASKFPQTPDYIRLMAATMYRKTGDLDASLDQLEEQLAIENLRLNLKLAQTPQQKEIILKRIKNLYNLAETKQGDLALIYQRRRSFYALYRAYLQEFNYLPLAFFQLMYAPKP